MTQHVNVTINSRQFRMACEDGQESHLRDLAKRRRVPILLVPLDTLETVRRIEEARGPVRLASPQQIERLRQLVRHEVDMDALLARMGSGTG